MLVSDLIRKQAHDVPDRVAMQLDGGGSLSFGQWNTASNRLGRALTRSGLDAGERVGLLMSGEAALDYAVSYMAIHKAGLVAVPLNPRLTSTEQQGIAEHCGLSALLFDDRVATAARRPTTTILSSDR